MIPTNRQLITLASRCVARLWKKDRAIYQPIWHLVLPDGSQEIITHEWSNKDLDAAAMRAVLAEKQVVAYCLVVEAWTLKRMGKLSGLEGEELRRIKTLATHPERQESVCYQAEDQTGALSAHQEIERRPGQKARLLPLEWLEIAQSEGRLVGMLPRKGAVH